MMRGGRLYAWLISVAAVMLIGAAPFQAGDTIALEGFFNARSDAKFGSEDSRYIEYMLGKGSTGKVTQVKPFSRGNYGIKLSVTSCAGKPGQCQVGDDVWVYYNSKSPGMTFAKDPAMLVPTQDPIDAHSARTERDTVAAQPLPDAVASVAEAARTEVTPPGYCPETEHAVGRKPAGAEDFETCNAKNNYLESGLKELSPHYTQSLIERSGQTANFPKECVVAAQELARDQGQYSQCTSTGISSDRKRPCLSEPYVYNTINSYLDVSECFETDPKESFATYALESGFHANAISTSQCAGIGQLNARNIQTLSGWFFDENRPMSYSKIKSSNRPACQRIAAEIRPNEDRVPSSKQAGRCHVMEKPRSTLLNLVFSHLLKKDDQNIIHNKLATHFTEAKAISGLDVVKVEKELNLLAYNWGNFQVRSAVRTYWDAKKARGEKISAEDLDLKRHGQEDKSIKSGEKVGSFVDFVYNVLKSSLGGADVNYVHDVAKRNKQVEAHLAKTQGISKKCSSLF